MSQLSKVEEIDISELDSRTETDLLVALFYFLPALQADQRCQVYKKVFLIAIKEHWGNFGGDGMPSPRT